MFKELSKPFVIAEMSGNHNQSLGRALSLVDEAAKTGVDALKIQTYTPDTITIDSDRDEFLIKDKDSLWKGDTLYSLYKKAYTPWDWSKPIFDKCAESGIMGFSTPFDFSAVDFLEDLGVSVYKIASFENYDLPLLKYVAKTGKPVIMSTGMIGFEELKESVDVLHCNGCPEVVLLKCTSTYPAAPENTNLLTISDMQMRFPECVIGLSDHTLGTSVSVAAVALGAMVIEKHFTISRADGGVDSVFSVEPDEMKKLIFEINIAYRSRGNVFYGSTEAEIPSLRFRRSLYVVKSMKKGELFTPDNIKSIRPSGGLSTKRYEDVLGKKAAYDILGGVPLIEEMITKG
ncbi:MAG: pseudaminic acid synthase [Chitinispirillales bacterium]|jgi:N-acetylneuraminate synthase|nr:pseudaminic acid synthase [Chitinispirillales bacterium]